MDEANAGKSISVAALGSAVKVLERLHNSGWQIFLCFFSKQLVTGALDFQQHLLARDQCQRGFHLIVRAEGIAPAMNKQ